MSERLKRFLSCKHKNIQQFTQTCLDCHENIYTQASDIEKEEEKAKLAKTSCPHKNIQQFTETCLDCGKNIYDE